MFSGGAWHFDNGASRLPAGPILSVAAAPGGRVYATGSYGGLYLYDGAGWRDFLQEHPGFPFPLAQRGSSLLVSDTVLFVTYAEMYSSTRIVAFSKGAWHSISQGGVLSEAADGRGGIWFIQGQESPIVELVHLNDTGFRKFTQPNSASYNLHVDPSGRLYRWGYYSPAYSVFRESDSSWIPGVDPDTTSVAKSPLSSLVFDPSGTLWGTFKAVKNTGGIVICALKPGGAWRLIAHLPLPVLSANSISQIVEGSGDSIWSLEKNYGTISVWDGNTWNNTVLLSNQGTPNELLFDDKGELWLSTYAGVVCRRSGSVATPVRLRLATDTLPFSLVKIARDREKNLWALGIRGDLGGSGTGTEVYVFRLESGNWKPLRDSLRLPFSYTNVSFMQLSLDPGQETWIRIGDSLYTFNESSGWRSQSSLLRRFGLARAANVIQGKKYVWIGGFDKGIIRIDGTDTVLIQALGSNAGYATPIAVDTNDVLWCSLLRRTATSPSYFYSGIVYLDGSGWQTLDSRSSGIPSETVNDIMFDRRGRMWVATDNGIGMFDQKNAPVRPDTRNSRSNRAVMDAAIDIRVNGGSLIVHTGIMERGTIIASDLNGRRLSLKKIPSRHFSAVEILRASATRIIVLSIDGIDANGHGTFINKAIYLR